jgi:Protein  of unknown function (DUF3018)
VSAPTEALSCEGSRALRTAAPARTASHPDLGPGVRAPAFRSEARRQSLAMAASFRAHDDQAFIDAVSIFI